MRFTGRAIDLNRRSVDSSHFFLDSRRISSHNGVPLNTIGASTENGSVAFTTTNWRGVLQEQGERPEARGELGKLCRTYWRPIYGFVGRHGVGPDEAKGCRHG